MKKAQQFEATITGLSPSFWPKKEVDRGGFIVTHRPRAIIFVDWTRVVDGERQWGQFRALDRAMDLDADVPTDAEFQIMLDEARMECGIPTVSAALAALQSEEISLEEAFSRVSLPISGILLEAEEGKDGRMYVRPASPAPRKKGKGKKAV
jgi:hypothetical protein